MSQESKSANPVIEKLRGEHGEVWALETSLGLVVMRAPTRAEFRRFLDKSANEANRGAALETLARDVVVHPDALAFGQMLEKKPGLMIKIASDAATIASDGETEHAKKALPSSATRSGTTGPLPSLSSRSAAGTTRRRPSRGHC